jgi:hypothetical protein
MMTETTTKIPFPVFNYTIYVVFTDNLVDTADKLVKQGKLRNPHNIDDTTDAFTVRMPNQSYTILVFKRDATVSQINHECYHALSNMFRWIGATHEEEIFAYCTGYLTNLVFEDQVKAKKKGLDKSKKV